MANKSVSPQVEAKLQKVADLYEAQILSAMPDAPKRVKPGRIPKPDEGTDLEVIRFKPKQKNGFWDHKDTSYLVGYGPHARFPGEGLSVWHIGFYMSPGFDQCAPFESAVERVLKRYAKIRTDFFVRPRGVILQNGHQWSYLGLIKRYKTEDLQAMAADLADLVKGTYPDLKALAVGPAQVI